LADYSISENELGQSVDFNRGEQRVFYDIQYSGTNAANSFLSSRVNWLYPDDRTVSISGDQITNSGTKQAITNMYSQYVNIYPTKEFSCTIPFSEPSGTSYFRKLFVIEYFNDLVGNNFNVPALSAGNKIIPSVNTVTANERNLVHVLYQVIGVKHVVGKNYTTTIKIKVLLADRCTIFVMIVA